MAPGYVFEGERKKIVKIDRGEDSLEEERWWDAKL